MSEVAATDWTVKAAARRVEREESFILICQRGDMRSSSRNETGASDMLADVDDFESGFAAPFILL